jgi:outer membrane biosynthesis protein TonB
MDEREKKEEKNKRIGWLTSIGVQLVLLILFYFIIAWREPFPPIPEYGIELGFTTSAGAPATSSPAQQAPETEEIPEEEQEESESSEAEQTESESEEIAEQPIPESKVESPVKVEEAKVEETKAATEEVKKVDSRSVMQPSETKSNKTSENPSEGDEEEKELDQRAIYGSKGTNTGDSEGANLALSGWIWDFKPKPDDTSDQSGKIVYKIVVDQDGYLVKIETITSTVSPTVERKYRQAVEKLTFSKTADYKTAPVSTGTITFIIKSR